MEQMERWAEAWGDAHAPGNAHATPPASSGGVTASMVPSVLRSPEHNRAKLGSAMDSGEDFFEDTEEFEDNEG